MNGGPHTGLLDRSAQFDSIQELDAARLDRYWDGLACALAGRDFGACYLFGYVIEMSLKAAYYRVCGVGMAHNLKKQMAAARQATSRLGARNLHDIECWAKMLINERDERGTPLDPVLAGLLLRTARSVAKHWSEIMRYRRSIPANDECAQLFRNAEWVIENHARFWS